MGKQKLLSSIKVIDRHGRSYTFQTLARRGAKEILCGDKTRITEVHINDDQNNPSQESDPEDALPNDE